MREARLDRGVAPTQRIILGVADLRCVLLKVKAIVVRDLLRQCREFRGGVLFGQIAHLAGAAVSALRGARVITPPPPADHRPRRAPPR